MMTVKQILALLPFSHPIIITNSDCDILYRGDVMHALEIDDQILNATICQIFHVNEWNVDYINCMLNVIKPGN